MKKTICLLMLVTFAFLCAACGDGDQSGSGDDGDLDGESDVPSDTDRADTVETADGDAGEAEAETADAPSEEDGDNFEADDEAEVENEAPPRLFVAADGSIQTQDGHALYLRGVNISGVTKYSEDHLFNLTQQDIDTLLSSGINSVRLLTYWKAVMPESPDEIDRNYIDAYLQRVKQLNAAGIFVIADMHQDLWGVPFVTHGAPGWACPEEIKAGYQPKDPWWLNYTTPQVKGCFDNFYADAELQDAFARSWAALAEALCADESTSKLLGFDLLNEPFPGSRIGDAEFDNEVLWPLYLKTMNAIETVCPGRLYFIEPSAAIIPADQFVFPAELQNRLVIAPHFYPSYIHEPGAVGYTISAEELAEDIADAFGVYLSGNVPVWIGEFGGISDNPNFDVYMRDLHGIFMRNFMSSAFWDYYAGDGGFAFLNSGGSLKTELQPVYTAPLPFEFPARPSEYDADFEAGTVEASFRCESGRHLKVLLANDGSFCESRDTDILAFPPSQPAGFMETLCLGDGNVKITCRSASDTQ